MPTLLDDDGFSIWDSHAINAYLVSKYAKNDSLYPKDVKKQAIVNQRLHFDSGVVYATLIKIAVSFYIAIYFFSQMGTFSGSNAHGAEE